MSDKMKVTHVVLSSGLMLHVVGSKEMVTHAFKEGGNIFLDVVVPMRGKSGAAELGTITVNRTQVEMITDDHDYSLDADVAIPDDEVILGD